jgi:hypothetical protein
MTTMSVSTPAVTVPKTVAEAQSVTKMRVAVHIDTVVLHPEVARRKANVWLTMYAGHLLRADNPELILKDGLFWRYEVILTSPHGGDIGTVGQIQVKAETGEVVSGESLADELSAQSTSLVKRQKIAEITTELEAAADTIHAETIVAR